MWRRGEKPRGSRGRELASLCTKSFFSTYALTKKKKKSLQFQPILRCHVSACVTDEIIRSAQRFHMVWQGLGKACVVGNNEQHEFGKTILCWGRDKGYVVKLVNMFNPTHTSFPSVLHSLIILSVSSFILFSVYSCFTSPSFLLYILPSLPYFSSSPTSLLPLCVSLVHLLVY